MSRARDNVAAAAIAGVVLADAGLKDPRDLQELLWACYLSTLLIAVGAIFRKQDLLWAGTLFSLSVGLPAWLIGISFRGSTSATSVMVHALPVTLAFTLLRHSRVNKRAYGFALGIYPAAFCLSLSTDRWRNINRAYPDGLAFFSEHSLWIYRTAVMAVVFFFISAGYVFAKRYAGKGQGQDNLKVATAACLLLSLIAVQAHGQLATDITGERRAVVAERNGPTLLFSYGRGVAPRALRADNPGIRSVVTKDEVLIADSSRLVPVAIRNGILLNVPQRVLFFFRDGELERTYLVGLGRKDWETPTGSWRVVRVEEDPTWHVPKSIQDEMANQGKKVVTEMKPGPENPLGRFAIRLNSSTGIHSTNAPFSIFHFQSHGCIRLLPEDAEDLFDRVRVGDEVRILYEPALILQRSDDILMEVHPDVYKRFPTLAVRLRSAARKAGIAELVDWQRVQRELSHPSERPINVTAGTPSDD